MNELAVRSTIKNLIVVNSPLLVTGLSFQGQPRSVHQVTYSSLTPPTGYYYINITVSNVRTNNRRGFGRTAAMSPSEAEYTVNIDISDYAVAIPGEDQLFERMDSEFQLFTDRLVAILRETYRITHSSGLSFRLDDERNVTKNNISTSWEEAAQYHALLYSRITLTLIEECTDDTTLYLS